MKRFISEADEPIRGDQGVEKDHTAQTGDTQADR